MSLEIFSAALDEVYAALGTDATFAAIPGETLTVIDKTAGVDLEAGNGSIKRPTLQPAAVVRRAELTSAGVTDLATIVNTVVTFNGKAWRIASHKSKPTPEGEDKGELYLVLRSS